MITIKSNKILVDVGQKISEIWGDPNLSDKEKMQLERWLKSEIAKGFQIKDEPLPKFLEKYRVKEAEANSLLEQ